MGTASSTCCGLAPLWRRPLNKRASAARSSALLSLQQDPLFAGDSKGHRASEVIVQTKRDGIAVLQQDPHFVMLKGVMPAKAFEELRQRIPAIMAQYPDRYTPFRQKLTDYFVVKGGKVEWSTTIQQNNKYNDNTHSDTNDFGGVERKMTGFDPFLKEPPAVAALLLDYARRWGIPDGSCIMVNCHTTRILTEQDPAERTVMLLHWPGDMFMTGAGRPAEYDESMCLKRNTLMAAVDLDLGEHS